MRVQVRLLVKSLVALGIRTSKGFFSSVNSKVRLQVEVKAEFLVADFALIWFLARMHKHVAFEFGVVEKSLIAKFKSALELNFESLQ